ncbi:MAG: GNAT family N-acetyltransferase [Bacteroidetes bacterium]|nr:GNAT family N-acetyltransferase [Bacteroidota bacterium]
MFTEKHFPKSIAGDELDAYLEQGWYRMGLSIFTCHFLFFNDSLYSPIWLRLPLEGLAFRKSLRKIMQQNRLRFRSLVRHSVINEEKEALFQKYRASFKGVLSATIRDSILDGKDHTIFDTFEVCVYDNDKLIAFSFFDLGNNSLASIKGVYDPEYARFSLGLYTMIEEIQFGVDLGFKYYYPGYFVPGFDRFDYKLRIGKPNELQFYDLKTAVWQPFNEYSTQNIPIWVLSSKLSEVGKILVEAGITSQMLYYPAYEANGMMFENERLLESPLFLTLFNTVFPRPRFIVYFDIWREKFVFTHCMPIEDLGLYFEYTMQFDTQEARHYLDFILKKTQIIETEDPKKILQMAIEIGKLIKPPGIAGILK